MGDKVIKEEEMAAVQAILIKIYERAEEMIFNPALFNENKIFEYGANIKSGVAGIKRHLNIK